MNKASSAPLKIDEEIQQWRDRMQALPPLARAKMQATLSQAIVAEPLRIETERGEAAFVLFGLRSFWRARSLLTKQPDTIRWIESFLPHSVFWDIGANVGAYTIYAALRSDIHVIALEPAAVNYFLLTANCEINGLDDRVDCLLVGVGDTKRLARIEVSQFDPGRSFSFRGKRKQPYRGRQAALILSIDQLIDEYDLPIPNYIKIDVPHLAESIVEGGAGTLQRPEVRELHLEASEDSRRDRGMLESLHRFGFVITGRHVREGTTDLTLSKQP